MSQEGINSSLTDPQHNIAHELMEEDLQRELARNELATRMALAKEQEAQEAKRRAMEAQGMMHQMMQKYEEMKSKLDNAKTALAETATKTHEKEQIIEKIQTMKERIEKYSNRKEAVDYLQDHVKMKFDHHSSGMEFLKDCHEENEKYQKVQQHEEEKAQRVAQLKEMMTEREKALEKNEKIKVMLERQLEIGEKRAAEQNRIASVREKLLELKMKELELQKAKLARKKKEQEEKERATDDFIAMIDKQLEDMNNTSGTPTQKKEALSAILEKHFNEEEKKEEASSNKSGAIPKEQVKSKKSNKNKVKSPEPTFKKEEQKLKTPEPKLEEKSKTPEPKVEEKSKTPEPSKSKNKKKNKNKNKNKTVENKEQSPVTEAVQVSQNTEVKTEDKIPEAEPEKTEEKTIKDESSVKSVKTAEQIKKDIAEYLKKSKETPIVAPRPVEAVTDKKLTEEEVKNMVANIEEKSERVRDDIADMAMSEQYLRTKQALLKAKKKEQEMQIAQRMASLREEEVIKMREKVAKMQELLKSRKTELKITEEIIHEKDGAKEELDKKIEASIRRQSYVEKKIVEKKCDNDNENDEQQS